MKNEKIACQARIAAEKASSAKEPYINDNILLQITYCGPLPLVSSEFTQPPFLWSGLAKNLPLTADIIADIIYAWP